MFLLLRTYNWFDKALQSAFAEAGWPSLTGLQSMVMVNIAAGVTRPSNIAKNMGVSPQNMNHLLQELKRKDLITLVSDSADLRAKHVIYTERARDMRIIAKKMMMKQEQIIIDEVGEKAYQDFLFVFDKIEHFEDQSTGSAKSNR